MADTERVICTKRTWDNLSTERAIYEPDPEAPSVHDLAETLRYAAKRLKLHRESEAIKYIDSIIARLEDA